MAGSMSTGNSTIIDKQIYEAEGIYLSNHMT